MPGLMLSVGGALAHWLIPIAFAGRSWERPQALIWLPVLLGHLHVCYVFASRNQRFRALITAAAAPWWFYGLYFLPFSFAGLCVGLALYQATTMQHRSEAGDPETFKPENHDGAEEQEEGRSA